MADTVTSTYVFTGTRRVALELTSISDGTGESAVVKIDKSTLAGSDGTEPSKLVIEEVVWNVKGFDSVKLAWDHTADDTAIVLTGNGVKDFSAIGGLIDPASSGGTGDLVLTTAGAVAAAVYDITILVRLKD